MLRKSRRITNYRNATIEENPVLVKHAGVYTLFTSRGFYGQCQAGSRYPYHTVYRQTRDLTKWPATPKRLAFPATTHVCGYGNAQVAQAGNGTWRIFWNGRINGDHTAFRLYTGKVEWNGGTPAVTKTY